MTWLIPRDELTNEQGRAVEPAFRGVPAHDVRHLGRQYIEVQPPARPAFCAQVERLQEESAQGRLGHSLREAEVRLRTG